MNISLLRLKPVVLACSLAIAGCGGSDSDPSDTGSDNASTTISGTAAAGAAIIGTVTVKGALGNTKSAIIEANGNYDVDVSDLTAPYRLRAQGTVGGKTYKLHSYAEAADVGGNVNITPFTDLIVANAAQQVAESFFDSAVTTSLDAAEVDAQETALQAKLQDVFDSLGVGTAIDLLNSTFSADHSGLDAALDIIKIESTSANIVTITNLLDNTSISDDITDTEDNSETIVVDDGEVETAVTDTQAIANLFDDFAAEFAGGLPSSSDIEDYLSSDFLQDDNTRGEFLTGLTTDPTLTGLSFTGVSISNLDSTAGTASVTFNVVLDGVIDPKSETWLVAFDETLGWQLRGDQRIVDINTLAFHCNDYDGTDNQPGSCGINVSFWDENFNNNGTGGAAIASGTFSLIDGSDGVTVKETVYLGNPVNTSAGEISIYNVPQGQDIEGFYSGDWREFGSGENQIDSSIFTAGDIIEYKVYSAELDVSDPGDPMVSGTEAAKYSDTLLFEPSLVGLYPTATTATINAIQNYSVGDNLTISWTLADGTVSDEVLVEIIDDIGNQTEIWDESFSPDTTTITVTSTNLDTSGLDTEAVSYELLVRIYAADEVTGQSHSTDYRATIDGPAAETGTGGETGGGTNPDLICGYESGWDDSANGGLGAPVTPNSFADYQTVLADCGGGVSATAQTIAGKSFVDFDETLTFFDTGAKTEQNPGTGQSVEGQDTIAFEWYIDSEGYIILYSDDTIEPDLPAGLWFRETSRLLTITSGTFYTFYNYSEQSNYSDTDRATGSDGEIWYPTYEIPGN